jgi:hypothetical protein
VRVCVMPASEPDAVYFPQTMGELLNALNLRPKVVARVATFRCLELRKARLAMLVDSCGAGPSARDYVLSRFDPRDLTWLSG